MKQRHTTPFIPGAEFTQALPNASPDTRPRQEPLVAPPWAGRMGGVAVRERFDPTQYRLLMRMILIVGWHQRHLSGEMPP